MIKKLLLVFTILFSFGLIATGQILNVTPTDQGVCNGEVEIINPSQYSSWNWYVNSQSISNPGSTLSNLCYGTEISVIVYSGNIPDTSTVFIDTLNTNPCLGFSAAIAQTAFATDLNTCDAELVATVSGGVGPYAYSWSGNSTSTTSYNNQACVGLNYVIVTDANGCTYTSQVVAYEDTSCNNFSVNVSTNNTNSYDCSGSANASVNTGTAPYSYLWSTTASTISSIQNQCYGSGNLEVTDANGCVASSSYFIDSNTICSGFQVALAQGANATSPISCDAVIYSTVQGGTMPYSYQWGNNNVTTSTNNQACSGTNTLVVTDANGCVYTATINVQATNICDSLTTSISITPTSSSSVCDGSVNTAIYGGTAPYSYSWSFQTGNPQTTATATNLCYGSGNLYVTDGNGCIDTVDFFIDTLSPCSNSNLMASIFISQNPSGANTCDGVVSAVVSGANGPYTLSWSGSTSGTTQQLTNVCPGAIYVTVIDANGCSFTAQSYVNSNPTSCAGFSISAAIGTVNNPILCDGNGTVTVTGGTAPYSYYWSNGAQTAATQSLCAGQGSIHVSDANGCSDSLFFYVDTLSNTLTAGVYVTPESSVGACDGQATVYPYGGVAPYSFSHASGQNTQTATGLCAGVYGAVITDATGNTYSIQYLISSPPNTSTGNGGIGTPIDTLYSTLVENCNIDYATVDTMYASSFTQYGMDSLSVTWAIVQGVDTNYMTYTYNLSNSNATGLTNVVLTIYCPFRGLGEYWMVSDNINLENGTSGISENEIAEIKVYQQFDDLSVWVILPNETHFTACLYDVAGKRIFEKSLFGQKEKINLDNVSKGKYVLTIQTEKLFKNTLISK